MPGAGLLGRTSSSATLPVGIGTSSRRTRAPTPGPGGRCIVQPHSSGSTSATATKTLLGIFPPAPMRRSPGHPEEAALQVHLALHVLALRAHLDGALQLALKLGGAAPGKGFWKLRTSAGIGLNVQPSASFIAKFGFLSRGEEIRSVNARVFLVVAVAVILLFKNAETPGAFLRHQVGGQGLRRLPGHWASPVCTEYSRADDAPAAAPGRGDALVLSALEIIAHFDPLMWVMSVWPGWT